MKVLTFKADFEHRGSLVSGAVIKVARAIFSMIDGYVSESLLCLGYMMVTLRVSLSMRLELSGSGGVNFGCEFGRGELWMNVVMWGELWSICCTCCICI